MTENSFSACQSKTPCETKSESLAYSREVGDTRRKNPCVFCDFLNLSDSLKCLNKEAFALFVWRIFRLAFRCASVQRKFVSNRADSSRGSVMDSESYAKLFIWDLRFKLGGVSSMGRKWGLRAVPPAGSRGRAPGQGVRRRSPLKLKYFWLEV